MKEQVFPTPFSEVGGSFPFFFFLFPRSTRDKEKQVAVHPENFPSWIRTRGPPASFIKSPLQPWILPFDPLLRWPVSWPFFFPPTLVVLYIFHRLQIELDSLRALSGSFSPYEIPLQAVLIPLSLVAIFFRLLPPPAAPVVPDTPPHLSSAVRRLRPI